MPIVTISSRAGDVLLLGLEHVGGVQTRANFNLLFPSQSNIDASYTHFAQNSFFNPGQRKHELRVSLSVPWRTDRFSLYPRLSIRHTLYDTYRLLQAEAAVSSAILGTQANLTVRFNRTVSSFGSSAQFIQSSLLLARLVRWGIYVRPQLDYDHQLGSISRYSVSIDKNIFQNGWIALSYSRDIISHTQSTLLTLRFEPSFLQVNSSLRTSGSDVVYDQNLRGTIAYDVTTNDVIVSRQSWQREGAITVLPFLDLNNNGVADGDEEIIHSVNVKINGGRVYPGSSTSPTRIVGLDAYSTYALSIDTTSLENPLWSPKHTRYDVTIDPNEFNPVYVPVNVNGEMNGNVSFDKNQRPGLPSLRGIKVFFHKMDGKSTTFATVDRFGDFRALGLPAGAYKIYPDSGMLHALGVISDPESVIVTIKVSADGDILDGIQFTLLPEAKKGTHEEGNADTIDTFDQAVVSQAYSVQVGAFCRLSYAGRFLEFVTGLTAHESFVQHDPKKGMYYVVVGTFDSIRQAKLLRQTLQMRASGLFLDAFIITRSSN
jgi:hypothetical protein